MVTFLITSLFIIGLLAVAVYFWQKPAATNQPEQLPPEPHRRSLFTGEPAETPARNNPGLLSETQRREILVRAQGAEKSALKDAQTSNDPELYQEALKLIVEQAEGPQLLSLVSYVCRNDLPVNSRLAEKFIESWKDSRNRNSTAQMLHVAALSNDAPTYGNAVQTALDSWLNGQLSLMSAEELRVMIDGEYWILSATTRSSGAGFILKQTLASARRELEAARSQNRAR